MGSENTNSGFIKLLEALRDFRTPIQLGALCIVIIYLVMVGGYDIQTKIISIIVITIIFISLLIPQWKKTELDAMIKQNKAS